MRALVQRRSLLIVGASVCAMAYLGVWAVTGVAAAYVDTLPPPAATPQMFAPGVVSTRDYERDGSFSPDGRTFYFSKRTIWPYFSAICVTHLEDGHWTTPEVASFSGEWSDVSPFVTADGRALYFASRRPVNGQPHGDFDLWMVERTAKGWGEPQHLPAPINGPGNELAPVLTASGTLYYTEYAPLPHIVRAEREGGRWLTPVAIGDTTGADGLALGAAVSADERSMVVSVVGRPDALHSAEAIYQRADLYVRTRQGAVWSALRHLPAPINSAADELAPMFTPDGRTLFFTSERGSFVEHDRPHDTDAFVQALHESGNGLGDIYSVPTAALELAP